MIIRSGSRSSGGGGRRSSSSASGGGDGISSSSGRSRNVSSRTAHQQPSELNHDT